MKRKLFTTLFAGLLLLGVALTGVSCSSDKNDIEETQWNIENFTVNASEWTWSTTNLRWEARKPFKFIDNFIYENGALVGYVFFGSQNVDESQSQLPYVSKTYKLDNGEQFTETLGYEYSILSKSVTFFIRPSDGIEDQDAKVTYNFRIAMIW